MQVLHLVRGIDTITEFFIISAIVYPLNSMLNTEIFGLCDYVGFLQSSHISLLLLNTIMQYMYYKPNSVYKFDDLANCPCPI